MESALWTFNLCSEHDYTGELHYYSDYSIHWGLPQSMNAGSPVLNQTVSIGRTERLVDRDSPVIAICPMENNVLNVESRTNHQPFGPFGFAHCLVLEYIPITIRYINIDPEHRQFWVELIFQLEDQGPCEDGKSSADVPSSILPMLHGAGIFPNICPKNHPVL